MDLNLTDVRTLAAEAAETDDLPGQLQSAVAQEPSSFGVPDLDPAALDYTRDDWDGDAAMARAPNPSDGEDARSQLRDMVAMYPTEPDDARDNKSNYKLPFRFGPDSPVNLTAVSAAIAAINGARGGVDGPEEALREAYNFLVRLGVEGGLYEERDDAPDFAASAAASGTAFRGSLAAEGPGDDLAGVVWASGDHTLYLNGKPTPVHVPEESIPVTHENLVAKTGDGSDGVKLGVDHGDSLHKDTNPVATELDLMKIGHATDFALSEDGTKVVMTDYELTAEEAVDAAEAGDLADGKDFSIVGDLKIVAEDGEPKTVESGGKERLVIVAKNVRQVDLVDTGAVSGAEPGNIPPLQSAAAIAAEDPRASSTAFVTALQGAAEQARTMSDHETLNDLTDLDSTDEVLDGAAEVVQAKDEQIQALEATVEAAGIDADEVDPDSVDDVTAHAEVVAQRAEAAAKLADFHDVDLAAEDGGSVQDLVDEHTAELRQEIAAKEAQLPSHDTGTDDGPTVEERADDLAGSDPADLQAMNGERATEILESEAARQEYAKAHAEGDGATSDVGASSGAGDDEVEAVAEEAMTLDDRREFEASSHDSAAEFMAERYDEDPANFVNEDNPGSAFVAATAAGD